MAKKKKVNRRAPKQEQKGVILSFITGLCLGLFVAFVVYLKGSQPVTTVAENPDQIESVSETEESLTAQTDEAEKPTFDFYTILPEREVKVPEWEPPKKKTKAGVEKSDGNLVFQVGSFQKHNDADAVKAKLTMLGLPVAIQKVVVNGQKVWFRVRVGPYSDDSNLGAVRQRLANSNLDYILLRVKDDE